MPPAMKAAMSCPGDRSHRSNFASIPLVRRSLASFSTHSLCCWESWEYEMKTFGADICPLQKPDKHTAKRAEVFANPINRYVFGSDNTDAKRNADGSFTVYIQNSSPGKDKEANWLPSPKGSMRLVISSYAPGP